MKTLLISALSLLLLVNACSGPDAGISEIVIENKEDFDMKGHTFSIAIPDETTEALQTNLHILRNVETGVELPFQLVISDNENSPSHIYVETDLPQGKSLRLEFAKAGKKAGVELAKKTHAG